MSAVEGKVIIAITSPFEMVVKLSELLIGIDRRGKSLNCTESIGFRKLLSNTLFKL